MIMFDLPDPLAMSSNFGSVTLFDSICQYRMKRPHLEPSRASGLHQGMYVLLFDLVSPFLFSSGVAVI